MKTMRELNFVSTDGASDGIVGARALSIAGQRAAVIDNTQGFNKTRFTSVNPITSIASTSVVMADGSIQPVFTNFIGKKQYQTSTDAPQILRKSNLNSVYYNMYDGSILLTNSFQSIATTTPYEASPPARCLFTFRTDAFNTGIGANRVYTQIPLTFYANAASAADNICHTMMVPVNNVYASIPASAAYTDLTYVNVWVYFKKTGSSMQIYLKQPTDAAYYFTDTLTRGGTKFGYLRLLRVDWILDPSL